MRHLVRRIVIQDMCTQSGKRQAALLTGLIFCLGSLARSGKSSYCTIVAPCAISEPPR
ncbi:hypothetical protein QL093DRAFT_2266534 [Fusarium oxysporum]|nr:hypothetical protein QL093DRAFT_2266534 [Fusarium oxysporum]